jgi:hypothetical protein
MSRIRGRDCTPERHSARESRDRTQVGMDATQRAMETLENVHAFSLMTKATKDGKTVDVAMFALSDVCRPTTVRLTHATDRPIKKPEVTMDPALPANHHASANDPNKVYLGANVEPATTSKVALLASWQEITDDLKQRSYEKKPLNAQLTEFKVLKKGKDTGTIKPVLIQFPFSDSR